jgi:hypothetical protein
LAGFGNVVGDGVQTLHEEGGTATEDLDAVVLRCASDFALVATRK